MEPEREPPTAESPPDDERDVVRRADAPADPGDLPVAAAPALSPVSPRNFCPICGAAWQPTWTTCEACRDAAARAEARSLSVDHAGRPLKAALALYFAVLLPVLAAILVTLWFGGEDPERVEVIVDLIAAVVITIVVLMWSFANAATLRPFLAHVAAPRWYFLAAVLAVATYAGASVAVSALHQLLGMPVLSYVKPLEDAGVSRPVIVLMICIQPAVIEELAFRGFILTDLQRVLSARDAALVSSIMFMVIHLSVPSFPHLLLIGLALSYLRLRSGSLYPCMLLHFLHNSAVMIAEMIGA